MTDFPIPEIENVRRYPIKVEKPPMYEAYGSIREMQEAKGMIEKGAPLWDYGIKEALRFPPNGDGIRCLCDGEELCQAHYLKLKQEHKNTDRACDFVGRAADL